MRFPLAIRARVVLVSAAAGLAVVAGCGDRDRATPPGEDRAGTEPRTASRQPEGSSAGRTIAVDTAELQPLLARAGEPGRLPEGERVALEQAMQRVLLPATAWCDGCRATVSYVDEDAGGDYFRCDLLAAAGERVAELQLLHRPYLPARAAESWGRTEVAGHPASALPGEALFVWAGGFEIRAFARDPSARAEGRLAGLIESLPLEALARL